MRRNVRKGTFYITWIFRIAGFSKEIGLRHAEPRILLTHGHHPSRLYSTTLSRYVSLYSPAFWYIHIMTNCYTTIWKQWTPGSSATVTHFFPSLLTLEARMSKIKMPSARKGIDRISPSASQMVEVLLYISIEERSFLMPFLPEKLHLKHRKRLSLNGYFYRQPLSSRFL